MIISGIYDLRGKKNSFFCDDVGHFEDDTLDIYAIDTTDKKFPDKLASLYKEYNVGCVNQIDDLFLAVVFEKNTAVLTIFSDVTTSPLALYYTENGGKLFYSTSLKWLLKNSCIKRALNMRSAKAFLANGYVYGIETLVENVFKLGFGSEILVSDGAYEQKHYPFTVSKKNEADAKVCLLSTIRDSVGRNFDPSSKVFMPLSGGYDSNMILDAIRRESNVVIDAFTIGGKTGKSEIDAVKKNVALQKNVYLHTALVDDSYYEALADIVWRLDGSVYEAGVFLQYALAKLASSAGAKFMLCGESSDEVQSEYYYESMKRALNDEAKPNEKFFVYADPFIGTNMVVLKKSAIMLNSFGIKGRYPFKSKSVVETAAGIAKLNGTTKKYYKTQCQMEFNPSVIKNIKTTGGTTNTSAAVTSEKQAFLNEILKSNKLLQDVEMLDYSIHTSDRTKRLRRQQGLERAIDEIKNKGIIAGLKSVKKSASAGSAIIIKKAYIVLFYNLFVSGKYDYLFDNTELPLKTTDILGDCNA